jgi:acyl-CoA synthetase (AMP-forming)/AMP-acid ligase II
VNIASVLTKSARRTPGATALTDLDSPTGRRDISYSELVDKAARSGASLRVMGLDVGDRVALLMRNSHEYVEAFYAAALSGLVVVPLNYRLLEAELEHMISDSGARLLIAEQELVIENPRLADLTELGVVQTRQSQPGVEPCWESLADSPTKLAVHNCDDHACLSMIYTSGTTGRPKGVMLSHGSWLGVSRNAQAHLRYRVAEETTLHSGPITHGSGFLVLPTLAVGGRNVISSSFDAERILRLFQEEGITNGFFVPTMIRMLLDAKGSGIEGRSSLKSLYYAGAPIDTQTLQEALDRFGDVLVQSYGQMEYPMFLTILSHRDHIEARSNENTELLGSAGRPVPGASIKIVSDNGYEVPVGEVGEIVARGPLTMLGYWGRPEATNKITDGEWLHTGDLGRIDPRGYLYVMGRKKDMIISGGMNVYAREVEEVLVRIPGVAQAAVVGVPHRKWGEEVTAVLVRESGMQVPDTEVNAACRAQLPGYRRPKRLLWIDELPKNPYGKILKRELRDNLTNIESTG